MKTTLVRDIDRIEVGSEAARLAQVSYEALIDLLEDPDPGAWQ